jgi:hypothetical protein
LRLLGGRDGLFELFGQEVIGRHDIGRLRLFERVHRILAEHVIRYTEDEERVHALVLAVRGHFAVVPGGAELGQINGQNLIDMDELASFTEVRSVPSSNRYTNYPSGAKDRSGHHFFLKNQHLSETYT